VLLLVMPWATPCTPSSVDGLCCKCMCSFVEAVHKSPTTAYFSVPPRQKKRMENKEQTMWFLLKANGHTSTEEQARMLVSAWSDHATKDSIKPKANEREQEAV